MANELAAWLEKQETRKTERKVLQISASLKPSSPMCPSKGSFINWSISCINASNMWLCQHNHGWEFGGNFFKMIFRQVQELAFKTYGAHRGHTQIDYLTEDVSMDPSHQLKSFFRLLMAYSEAKTFLSAWSNGSRGGFAILR